VPESAGGIGLTPDALAHMAMELGESLVVEPWYWTSAIAAALAGNVPESPALRDVVQGSRLIGLACSARGMRTDPYAFHAVGRPAGTGWPVDAELAPTWGGFNCDEIWLPVQLDAHSNAILRADPGAATVQRRSFRTYDGR